MTSAIDAAFSRIDMSNLRYIGSGAFNICLTDGIYAIKIGHTSQYTVDKMKQLYECGIGIEVIDYVSNAELPQALVTMIELFEFRVMSYGKKGYAYPLQEYINIDKRADILITELVKPVLSHKRKYSDSYCERMYNQADRLSKLSEKLTGERWYDNHPWNMGRNKHGNLVILDV